MPRKFTGSMWDSELKVTQDPCFSPDGKQIVYTADPQGYGQVFVVDISAFDSLPDKA